MQQRQGSEKVFLFVLLPNHVALDLGLSDSPGSATGSLLFFQHLSPSYHGAMINTTPQRTRHRISLDLLCIMRLCLPSMPLGKFKGSLVYHHVSFFPFKWQFGVYIIFQLKPYGQVTTSCSKVCSTQLTTVNHFLEPEQLSLSENRVPHDDMAPQFQLDNADIFVQFKLTQFVAVNSYIIVGQHEIMSHYTRLLC